MKNLASNAEGGAAQSTSGSFSERQLRDGGKSEIFVGCQSRDLTYWLDVAWSGGCALSMGMSIITRTINP